MCLLPSTSSTHGHACNLCVSCLVVDNIFFVVTTLLYSVLFTSVAECAHVQEWLAPLSAL